MSDAHQTTPSGYRPAEQIAAKMSWRGPADDALDFWRKEAQRTADALEASRRENLDLERHYRVALVQISELQRQVRVLMQEGSDAG